METFDSSEKAVGTGIGQFVEINESQTQAIVKVDAATYFQIDNCCKARDWCLGLRMNRTELAEDVNTFEITVDLDLKQSFVLRPATLYGIFIHFHWTIDSEKQRLRITRLYDAIASEWCRYESTLAAESESEDDLLRPKLYWRPTYVLRPFKAARESDDESDEEEAPIMKFFKEHCLPPQAEIPGQEQKNKAPHQAVTRPARKRPA